MAEGFLDDEDDDFCPTLDLATVCGEFVEDDGPAFVCGKGHGHARKHGPAFYPSNRIRLMEQFEAKVAEEVEAAIASIETARRMDGQR